MTMHAVHAVLRFWVLLACALTSFTNAAQAGIIDISNGDVLVGDRASNLLTNGSFESGHPSPGVDVGWTPGTLHVGGYPATEVAAIPGWTSSYDDGAYGSWGAIGVAGTGPAHGANQVYFGNWFADISEAPIVHPSGEITFAAPPVFTNDSGLGPLTLSQTVTGLAIGQTYLLDFFVTGEENMTGFTSLGLFGLGIGSELRYLGLPTAANPFGASQRYQITFSADATTLDFAFTNWGHLPGQGTEIVLDDVVLNVIPEPGTALLLGLGLLGLATRDVDRRMHPRKYQRSNTRNRERAHSGSRLSVNDGTRNRRPVSAPGRSSREGAFTGPRLANRPHRN